MAGPRTQHPGVRESRRALLRHRRVRLDALAPQPVGGRQRAGAGDDRIAREGLGALGRVGPIKVDESSLLSQQLDRGVELLLVELVDVLDSELRLVLAQVEAASAMYIGSSGAVTPPGYLEASSGSKIRSEDTAMSGSLFTCAGFQISRLAVRPIGTP